MAEHQQNQPKSHSEDFFIAGGTLKPNAQSYVQRAPDDELLRMTSEGEFCYVLTPRQMGKSSLMTRTSQRLRKQGIRTAIIDLTQIGSQINIEQWYLGLISQTSRQLKLNIDYAHWWQSHALLSEVQRFNNFFSDIVLIEVNEKIVIFIDEIDSTLQLNFRDDFFAAIRAIYNARADFPEFLRLNFVLLGVASPSDLIQDVKRTPFNIGHAIALKEFTKEEAYILQDELRLRFPKHENTIFNRIFYWTNGHPYLTQKLCLAVTEQHATDWNDKNIDLLVKQLFFTESARKESNLQYVQNNILGHSQKLSMLKTYSRILHKKSILDDGQSPVQNQLKLAGLLKVENGYLQLRNRIYQTVFDKNWVSENTPINLTRILAGVVVILITLVLSLVGLLAYDAYIIPQQANNQIANFFKNKDNPQIRIKTLATTFNLRQVLGTTAYESTARDLFFGLSGEEQLSLFNTYDNAESEDIITVVKGLYVTLADVDNDDTMTPLLEGMRDAINVTTLESPLKKEISAWILGRKSYRTNNMKDAKDAYDSAIALNPSNPATRFERARVLTQLKEIGAALADLQQVVSLAKNISNLTPTPSSPLIITLSPTPAKLPIKTSLIPQELLISSTISSSLQNENSASLTTATITSTPTPTPNKSFRSKFENAVQIKSAVIGLITNDSILVDFINKNNQFDTLRLLLPISLVAEISNATNTTTPTPSPTAIVETTPTTSQASPPTFIKPTITQISSLALKPITTPTPTAITKPLRQIPVLLSPYGNDSVKNLSSNIPTGNIILNGILFNIAANKGKLSTQCDGDIVRDYPTSIRINVQDIQNPETIRILINSGYSWVEFKNKEIGAILMEFSDNKTFSYPLILGQNIREWNYGSSIPIVNTISNLDSQGAFSGITNNGFLYAIDLLTINIPKPYQTSQLSAISFYDLPLQNTLNPCLIIIGLTVEAR